jgi:hypothetical protein
MPTTTTGIATEFITFSRPGATGGGATVTDSDGLIKWAPHNLLTGSESFDSALWLKSGIASVSANNTAAPNGTTTADKFLEDTSVSAQHLCNKSISVGGDQTYSLSCFAKSAERTNIALQLATTGGTVTRFGANFDLSAGTVSKTDSVSSPVNTSSSITSLGSGWYLCTIKMTTISAATALYCYVGPSDSNNPTFSSGSPVYTGVSGNGAFFWGASLSRSDLGGMQPNTSAYPLYNPTIPKNLLGYTEDFTQGVGVAYGSIGVANVVTAPNGLMTADELRDDGSASNYHYMVRSVATVANSTYVLSGYFKANTSSYVILSVANFATSSLYASASFNLTSGTLVSASAVGTGYSIVGTPTITAVGSSGWYRCAVVVTAGTTAPTTFAVGLTNDGTFSNYGLKVYNGSGSGIFGWGIQVSDSASLDTYVPVYGAFVASAAYYGPRRDFNGATLACNGLLVEEQRTNLLLYSADLLNAAYWSLYAGATRAANSIVSPDGLTTSYTVTGSGSNFSSLYQNSASTNGLAYTSSVYVKAGTAPFALILLDAGLSARWVNLSTGEITGSSGPVLSAVATPVGNGWYRVAIAYTATSTANAGLFVGPASASLSQTSTGTIYAWSPQTELGSFATSYIPTGSTTATRTADIAKVSTQAFPYSNAEGSIVVNASVSGGLTGSNNALVSLDDGSVNNSNFLYFSNATPNSGTNVGGVTQQSIGISAVTVTANTAFKSAMAYKTNDFAATANGATVVTDTSGAVPSGLTVMNIGNYALNLIMNGYIRQITYLPRRISNAELQTRTTL